MFAGKLQQRFGANYTLNNTTTAVRFTWYGFGYRYWNGLCVSSTTEGNNISIMVEGSSNGTSWTTLLASTNIGGNWPGYNYVRWVSNNSAANPYLRITIFNSSSNGNAISLQNLSMVGSYGGFTPLYTWDSSRNITMPSFLGIGSVTPIRTLHTYGEVSQTPLVANGNTAFYNIHDVNGSNGGNYTLHIRGLGSAGTVEVALSAVVVNAGSLQSTGDIIAYSSSDATLKTNLTPIANPVAKVQQLTGYEFDWTDEYLKSIGTDDEYFARKHDIGLVAQQVENVIPEVVGTRPNGIKAVKYDRLVALLIEAVKDQQQQIDELKEELRNSKK
jgi:hypothetical protein